jgi:hypothetical protein
MVAPLGVGLSLTQAVIFGFELGDHALQFADALLAALAPGCLSFCVRLPHASYVTEALRQDEGSFIYPGCRICRGSFSLSRSAITTQRFINYAGASWSHPNTPRGGK